MPKHTYSLSDFLAIGDKEVSFVINGIKKTRAPITIDGVKKHYVKGMSFSGIRSSSYGDVHYARYKGKPVEILLKDVMQDGNVATSFEINKMCRIRAIVDSVGEYVCSCLELDIHEQYHKIFERRKKNDVLRLENRGASDDKIQAANQKMLPPISSFIPAINGDKETNSPHTTINIKVKMRSGSEAWEVKRFDSAKIPKSVYSKFKDDPVIETKAICDWGATIMKYETFVNYEPYSKSKTMRYSKLAQECHQEYVKEEKQLIQWGNINDLLAKCQYKALIFQVVGIFHGKSIVSTSTSLKLALYEEYSGLDYDIGLDIPPLNRESQEAVEEESNEAISYGSAILADNEKV